jgi:hypothetical protein
LTLQILSKQRGSLWDMLGTGSKNYILLKPILVVKLDFI